MLPDGIITKCCISPRLRRGDIQAMHYVKEYKRYHGGYGLSILFREKQPDRRNLCGPV